jgi:hypothetical protein
VTRTASISACSPRWSSWARRSPISTARSTRGGRCRRGRSVLLRRPRRGRGADGVGRVADLVDIARGAVGPTFGRPAETSNPRARAAGSRFARSAFYLRFDVLDVPGVLAEIASRLAEGGVSIESMIQRGRAPGEPVAIVMITHECSETAVAAP